jgi:predicted small metal-binding protein
MKKMTCRDMGGTCDMEVTGETMEEMMENGKQHVHSQEDEGHKQIVSQMEAASPEEMEAWKRDFAAKFESAPDA